MHLQMSVESNIISKASINVFVLCWSTDMENPSWDEYDPTDQYEDS